MILSSALSVFLPPFMILNKRKKRNKNPVLGRTVFEVAVPNIWRLEPEMMNVMAANYKSLFKYILKDGRLRQQAWLNTVLGSNLRIGVWLSSRLLT